MSSGESGDELVYLFKSTKDMEREKEQAPYRAEIDKMMAGPDDVEVTEMPEDVVEVKEHGGGVKLF